MTQTGRPRVSGFESDRVLSARQLSRELAAVNRHPRAHMAGPCDSLPHAANFQAVEEPLSLVSRNAQGASWKP